MTQKVDEEQATASTGAIGEILRRHKAASAAPKKMRKPPRRGSESPAKPATSTPSADFDRGVSKAPMTPRELDTTPRATAGMRSVPGGDVDLALAESVSRTVDLTVDLTEAPLSKEPEWDL